MAHLTSLVILFFSDTFRNSRSKASPKPPKSSPINNFNKVNLTENNQLFIIVKYWPSFYHRKVKTNDYSCSVTSRTSSFLNFLLSVNLVQHVNFDPNSYREPHP